MKSITYNVDSIMACLKIWEQGSSLVENEGGTFTFFIEDFLFTRLEEQIWSREKQRVIQECVPEKRVTLAHIIAGPNKEIHTKLGLLDDTSNVLGILTITPGEVAIIVVDIATKSGDIQIGFIDYFSGSVVASGGVSSVGAVL